MIEGRENKKERRKREEREGEERRKRVSLLFERLKAFEEREVEGKEESRGGPGR